MRRKFPNVKLAAVFPRVKARPVERAVASVLKGEQKVGKAVRLFNSPRRPFLEVFSG